MRFLMVFFAAVLIAGLAGCQADAPASTSGSGNAGGAVVSAVPSVGGAAAMIDPGATRTLRAPAGAPGRVLLLSDRPDYYSLQAWYVLKNGDADTVYRLEPQKGGVTWRAPGFFAGAGESIGFDGDVASLILVVGAGEDAAGFERDHLRLLVVFDGDVTEGAILPLSKVAEGVSMDFGDARLYTVGVVDADGPSVTVSNLSGIK